MTNQLENKYSKQRIRIAVFSFFIAQGLCFASWASRLPDIKNDFGVDSLWDFGILMFLIPIGKFAAIPTVGFLLPRIGSKKTVIISILGFILSTFIVSISHNVYGLGIVLLLFGMFWNMTDISLNTQAIETERIYGKPIIATFHASWSLAACVGALIGYFMINMNVNTFYHFLFMTIFTSALVLFNYKYLQEKSVEDAIDKSVEKTDASITKPKSIELLLIKLGIVWLLTLIIENTMFEWSDVYFQSVIKAPESLQVGFLVFMVMMFIGRLATNYLYQFLDKDKILRLAGLLIFVGFTISSIFIGYSESMVVKVIINSLGFMLIGLGIACMMPTIYSIVAERSKTPTGTALTIMSSISFVGPLIAPLLVGGIADKYSLQWAYFVIGIFGVCIIAISYVKKR